MGQAVPETKRDSLPCPSFEGCRRASRSGSWAVRLTACFAATLDWSGGGRSFRPSPRPRDEAGFSAFGADRRLRRVDATAPVAHAQPHRELLVLLVDVLRADRVRVAVDPVAVEIPGEHELVAVGIPRAAAL